MRPGSKRITKDMIEAAAAKGWNATQAARHYEVHRTSIAAAGKRYGIELAESKFNAHVPSARKKLRKERVDALTLAKKKTSVFSCSPDAVERALKKLNGGTNV